jgi:WD40 repeat protein
VATAGHDGRVMIWDARSGECLGGLADHRNWVTRAAYSPPDGRFLASSSCDSTVRLWDFRTGAYHAVLDGFDGWWVLDLSFSPDGAQLATIDQNGQIRIWDVAQGSPAAEIAAGGFNTTVSWSPDGRHLTSGGLDGAQVWKIVAQP